MTEITLRDIVVTTPQRLVDVAAQEARACREAGGGNYFRTFFHKPKALDIGSRIYYVEHPYVRGFGVVSELVDGSIVCDTTGIDWAEGYHAILPADSWNWIKPVTMRGFQGWKYFNKPRNQIQIVGNWLDPKPVLTKYH
jgi:hypothetical protein